MSLTNAKNHEETGFESFVRVNMGNIYFKQEKHPMAVRMYKKALDIVPANLKLSMRYKIMKNLGHCYVQLNQYFDAITIYEEILDKSPDFESAFNLMLCYFTKGDKEKMKNNFCEIINIESYGDGEEDHFQDEDDEKENQNSYKDDPLGAELRKRKKKASKIILDSAKLIAPVIDEDIIEGYNWIIDILKGSKSNYHGVQSEIEIKKAI